MPAIERVVRFVTDGKEFPTWQKARDYREGLVEKFLRVLPGFQDILPKTRIAFIQSILDGRQELRDLLNFSSKEEEQDD